MTPDQWTQIDQLLAKALEQPETERPAFLAEACAGNEALRREVASLLVAHQEAEAEFLSTPALETAVRELAAQPHASLAGSTLGPYSLLSVLGIGGMGEVYLARDERMRRQLALKILPPQFVADTGRVERFAREARAVSALNHPNIVTVYDIGQLDGTHFIAMEHVDGQTLREKIQAAQQEPLDAKDVIEIALQISAAHAAGITHRDIKPENLMLRRDDYVKVLDFGLAKLTEPQLSLAETLGANSDAAATNPGTVLGTLRYMSPEQAQGREVDGRSDLFSLGVVLYELLTGSAPFKGDKPAAILDAVVHHTPLPLTQLRPDVNPEFERIIVRLLEKDRERRFPSAEDLRTVFKEFKRALDSDAAHAPHSDSGKLAAAPQRRQAPAVFHRDLASSRSLPALARQVSGGNPHRQGRGDAAQRRAGSASLGGATTLEMKPGCGQPRAASDDGVTSAGNSAGEAPGRKKRPPEKPAVPDPPCDLFSAHHQILLLVTLRRAPELCLSKPPPSPALVASACAAVNGKSASASASVTSSSATVSLWLVIGGPQLQPKQPALMSFSCTSVSNRSSSSISSSSATVSLWLVSGGPQVQPRQGRGGCGVPVRSKPALMSASCASLSSRSSSSISLSVVVTVV